MSKLQKMEILLLTWAPSETTPFLIFTHPLKTWKKYSKFFKDGY